MPERRMLSARTSKRRRQRSSNMKPGHDRQRCRNVTFVFVFHLTKAPVFEGFLRLLVLLGSGGRSFAMGSLEVLEPPGKRLHDVLRAKDRARMEALGLESAKSNEQSISSVQKQDIERSGTLAQNIFQETLQDRGLLLFSTGIVADYSNVGWASGTGARAYFSTAVLQALFFFSAKHGAFWMFSVWSCSACWQTRMALLAVLWFEEGLVIESFQEMSSCSQAWETWTTVRQMVLFEQVLLHGLWKKTISLSDSVI